MMYHSLALIALSACLSYSVEGFSVGPVAFSRPATSTCLFAEEPNGDAAAPQEETAAGDDGEPTDILNSPAFLQRKLDVVKSDIAKVEESIKDAKLVVEEGKAEWAQQFENIEAEVSSLLCEIK
jgi:hypothetical protein